MARIETNFMELLLINVFSGMTIYTDDDVAVVIGEINYDPLVNSVFIIDANNGDKHVFNWKKNHDFEIDNIDKIVEVPNKKNQGKRDR